VIKAGRVNSRAPQNSMRRDTLVKLEGLKGRAESGLKFNAPELVVAINVNIRTT
jgi:hypothetical protein